MAVSLFIFLLSIGLLFSKVEVKAAEEERDEKGKKETKLDLGLGLLSFQIPHYRGSDQTKDYFIPIPFFSYSSQNIEAEPSFFRGTFFRKGPFAVKLSIIAGLAVESETNKARKGMPDLGFTLEIGPMLLLRLWTSQDKKHYISLDSPFRYVVELDGTPLGGVGFFTVPYITFSNSPRKETWGWGSELSLAIQYADKNFHAHYYSVKPEYESKGRHSYAARGGRSGMSILLLLNRQYGSFHFLPFVRYDSLKGAVFEESPLVRKKDFFLMGLGLFWIFHSIF